MQQKLTSRTFDVIVARAIIDSDFRALLLKDKKEAIKEYQLTEADLHAIDKLDEKTLAAARETATIVGMVCKGGPSTMLNQPEDE